MSAPPQLTVVTCLIEKGREALICTMSDDSENRIWEFPIGEKRRQESHEAAMRRVCRDSLRLHIKVHQGQPPFIADFDGQRATYRFFLATLQRGEPETDRYHEARWVPREQLREYDFSDVIQPIVDWYLG